MKNYHKGWLILSVIVLCILASLGFGRFSFGAIMPFMREGLTLDYRETGLIASSVFFGYLISNTIVGYFVIQFKAKKVIVFSLGILAVAMILTANAIGFWTAYIGCFLIGIGTGGANVPSLGLIGQWFSPKFRGMAMGIAMGGAGIGIVFSGFIVPSIVSYEALGGWRASWYTLAIAVLFILFISIFFLRNSPKDFGLKPIGGEVKQINIKQTSDLQAKNAKDHVYKNKIIWMIGFIYLCWGFSYLIFSTFLVDYLMTDIGLNKNSAGQLFAAAGFASIVSGFIWGTVSDRLGRMAALSIVFFIEFLMLLGLTFSTHYGLILLQIIIYGITLWGVPSIMNASVGDFISLKYVPVAMGFLTLFFSLGQLISPIFTGYLIDSTNSYLSSFLLSTFICLTGGLGCLKLHFDQRKKRSQPYSNKEKYTVNEN